MLYTQTIEIISNEDLSNQIKSATTEKTTVIQRLQNPLQKRELSLPYTSGISYAQVTKKTNQPNKPSERQNNEPTMKDLMAMLNQFQSEMKNSFGQLACRVEKLKRAQAHNK